MKSLILFCSIFLIGIGIESRIINDFNLVKTNATTGAEYKSRQIQVALDSDNPDDTYNIGSTTHQVTGFSPTFNYVTLHIGGQTIQSMTFGVSVSIVDSLVQSNATRQITIDPTIVDGSSSTRRRLLSFWSSAFKGVVGFVPGFGEIADSIAAKISGGDAEWCKGSKDLFNACPDANFPKEEFIDYLMKDKRWTDTIEHFNLEIYKNVNLTNEALRAARDANLVAEANMNKTLERFDAQNAKFAAITQEINDQVEATRAAMAEIQARNQQALILLEATNKAELENFANQTRISLIALTQSINDFRNDTMNNIAVLNQKVDHVSTDVQRLAAALHDYIEEVVPERALTSMIWDKIDVATSLGLKPFLLSGSGAGERPATIISSTDRSELVNSYINNFVTTGAGQVAFINSQVVEYWCDAEIIQSPSFITMDFSRFMSVIGPTGCSSNTLATTVNRCDCWFTFTQKSCRPVAGFTWSSISPNSTFTQHQIVDAQSPYCASDYQVTGPTIVDKASEFLNRMKNLCQSTLAGTFTKFQTVSLRTFERWYTDVTPTSDCNIDITSMFITGTKSATVSARLLRNIFDKSWSIAKQLTSQYRRYQDGLLPNLLYVNTLPYQANTETGTHYKSHQAMFAAMSPISVPIFLVSLETTEARVVDTADESIINIGSTPFIVSETALPGKTFLIFGDLRADSTFVYDVPIDMQSYSSSPIGRQGSVTYNMCPVPNGYDISMWDPNDPASYPETCSLEEWLNQNKYIYDHRQGSLDLSDYKRTIVNGKCVGNDIETSGPICTLLKSWTIGPETNVAAGKFVIRPDKYNYPLTVIDIDSQEQLYQIVNSSCPDVRYTAFTDTISGGGAGQLVYSNPWEFKIEFIARRSSDSPQCPILGDLKYTLTSKKDTVVKIPTCHNYILQLYRLDAQGNQFFCSATNITHDPASSTNIHPAEIGASNETIIVDNILGELSDIARDSAINLLQAVTFAKGEIALTLPEYRAMNSSALQEALARMISSDALRNLSAFEFNARMNNLSIAEEKIRQEQIALRDEFHTVNQVFSDRVDDVVIHFTNITDALVEEQKAKVELDEARDRLIDALNRTHFGNTNQLIMWICIAVSLAMHVVWIVVIFVIPKCCNKGNKNRGDYYM